MAKRQLPRKSRRSQGSFLPVAAFGITVFLGALAPAYAQSLKINFKPLLDYFDPGWERNQRLVLIRGTYRVSLDPKSQSLPGCVTEPIERAPVSDSNNDEDRGGVLDTPAPLKPAATATVLGSSELSLVSRLDANHEPRFTVLEYDVARSAARAAFREKVPAYCKGQDEVVFELSLKSLYADAPTKHTYTFRLDPKGPYIQLPGVGKLHIGEP